MRIDCPTCGRRDVREFTYAEVPDPPPGLEAGAAAVDRRFFSANPAGIAIERWFHGAGCRRWLTLHRDRAQP